MSESVARIKVETRSGKSSIHHEVQQRKRSIHPLNERVRRLREDSLTTKVTISAERARLLTQFYQITPLEHVSVPVQRALAFQYLLEHCSLPIEHDQMFVGIRGTGVNEVPTFPEICCHSVQDLDLLSSRENNPYQVPQETLNLYTRDIIPYWKDKSIRTQLFQTMSREWTQAYRSGVFTEFMEQRAPGHTAGDQKLFTTGLLEIKKQIQRKQQELQPTDPHFKPQREELKAMDIVADAMITYSHRYADALTVLYNKETHPERKQELYQMIQISRWVPAHAPRTFWEALQHYWYIHIGIIMETNPWDAFSPGRLDQHLSPFYHKEIQENTLTREQAKELLELFWLKFNSQPAPPKVGVTASESNTYNDFSKINIGGLTTQGEDAVTELSYLILEVLEEMRTVQPNTAAQISTKTPDVFLHRCLEVIKPGFGEPPLFNFDGVVRMLQRQKKTLTDAYEGGCSGCVETGAFGKESYILTGYFNLPKVLEITLNNGVDPRTGTMVGVPTGENTSFHTFEEFMEAFNKQLQFFLTIKMNGNDRIEQMYADLLPVPFLSLWIDDCIENATDYNAGGARYNSQYLQFVGLGTLTDALASIKYHVFEKNTYPLSQVTQSLRNDYQTNEEMRQIFLHKTPKYGNDDDDVDSLAQEVFNTCVKLVERSEHTPTRNASRRVYFLPTTVHVYFGQMCGATPDGRHAGTPLSEGISPVQGADRQGITAVLRSIGKLNHRNTGGTLLNQRVSPELLQTSEVKQKFGQLIRAYFTMGGHHIQFNIVSTTLLREAQQNPLAFQDLMVRVAGYSDYFVRLPKGLQDEIISRTEQAV
jgi:formate C-acetyltransferase